MKALIYQKKKFEIKEIIKPDYKPNQVLIRVVSTSLNAGDYRLIQINSVPKSGILGNAIAGIVEEVGTDVKTLHVGDRIVCDTSDVGFGGLVEYIAVDESLCIQVPLNVSLLDASACPVASTTALDALRLIRPIKEDEKLLILGASGGVGTFLIQLAKYYKAHVTAIVSTNNVEQARDLGADVVINYKRDDINQLKLRYDRILSVNGTYSHSFYNSHLKENGILVMIGGSIKQLVMNMLMFPIYSLGNKKYKLLASKTHMDNLKEILELVSKKQIKPIIEKVYPFHKSAEALTEFSKGHAKGKIVIQISNEIN